MKKAIDLTGNKFGFWIVQSRAGNVGLNPTWHCICVCGATREVQGRHLISGQSKSCGCGRVGEKRKKKDLTGNKFGKWFVLNQSLKETYGDAYWTCECECGTKKDVLGRSLKSGKSSSCGCARKESLSDGAKHGHNRAGKRTPTYQTWSDMKRRCSDAKHKSYSIYGGKGIKVCDRWEVFSNFLEDMGDRPEGKTLDRIDSKGDYCADNCKWSTPKEQARNMRSNHYIEYDGKRMIITDWAEYLGIKEGTIRARLSRGWSDERALSK